MVSAAIQLHSSCVSHFVRSSKVKLEQSLYAEALYDAEKVIEHEPSSYLGYELKHAALHGAQHYGEALDAFKIMLSKLDDTSDAQIRKLHRDAQINAFMESTEYKKLLYSSMMHVPLQIEPIEEAVAKYFGWVMLSHRWESKEPLLYNIQDKVVYDLDPVGTAKLQKFCQLSRDAGYHWDVSPSSGTLADSAWNTRGWTVQEFLAPRIILFYQANWTLYLNDNSPNHKESVPIMQELESSTGIDAQALFAFHPGMSGARAKLQWASSRITMLQEDIAYSLFGIFGVHLPVIYGETKQNALGRLLQEIVAQSGDITALDWFGNSSEFNSCLPAEIASYKTPPSPRASLSEDEMLISVSRLRNTVAVESALELYTRLDTLSAPRFANRRLHLPCIAFPVTAIRRRRRQDQESCHTYEVEADGLQDMLITTKEKLIQFSLAGPTRQPFLLVRSWNCDDLYDLADDARSVDEWSSAGSYISGHPGDDEPVDSDHALRLIVCLGQPFGALFLAQQRGGEYKRIASDHNIIAQVKDMTSVDDMMDTRTLEILYLDRNQTTTIVRLNRCPEH
ncbi:hypothetical protein DFH29DRAFT_1067269 [Suillus ampliporus]|nr:hypothetical protein DFH29DRAFT_1067269 [Suillus ampliporus]